MCLLVVLLIWGYFGFKVCLVGLVVMCVSLTVQDEPLFRGDNCVTSGFDLFEPERE
jgi:hypothetical protein